MHELLKILNDFDLNEVNNNIIIRASYEEILFRYLIDMDENFNKRKFIEKIKQNVNDKSEIIFILHEKSNENLNLDILRNDFKNTYRFLNLAIDFFSIYNFNNYRVSLLNPYSKTKSNIFLRFLSKLLFIDDRKIDYNITYCFITIKM